MVLKSPAEPLGSPADGVIRWGAHANGTQPRSRDPRYWGRTRSADREAPFGGSNASVHSRFPFESLN
jgi:hypothetical protein